jgi:aryl-alcohol dehydrogenase-like predicted oxidoreductase
VRSPIVQSRLARNAKLVEFAGCHGLTPTQAALAWLLAFATYHGGRLLGFH